MTKSSLPLGATRTELLRHASVELKQLAWRHKELMMAASHPVLHAVRGASPVEGRYEFLPDPATQQEGLHIVFAPPHPYGAKTYSIAVADLIGVHNHIDQESWSLLHRQGVARVAALIAPYNGFALRLSAEENGVSIQGNIGAHTLTIAVRDAVQPTLPENRLVLIQAPVDFNQHGLRTCSLTQMHLVETLCVNIAKLGRLETLIGPRQAGTLTKT